MIRRTLHVSVFAIFAFTANASAELVTYQFSGILDIDASVSDPTRWPGINVGDHFEGTVTIDSNPPMSMPGDRGSVLYDWPLTDQGPAAALRVGQSDFFWPAGSGQGAQVRNGLGEDTLNVSLSRSIFSGSQPGGETLSFRFTDLDGAAFSNNSFPTFIDFGLFEGAEFQVSRIVNLTPLPAFSQELNLRGTIQSFAVIPEPGTWLLLSVALMVAVAISIQRRRQVQSIRCRR